MRTLNYIHTSSSSLSETKEIPPRVVRRGKSGGKRPYIGPLQFPNLKSSKIVRLQHPARWSERETRFPPRPRTVVGTYVFHFGLRLEHVFFVSPEAWCCRAPPNVRRANFHGKFSTFLTGATGLSMRLSSFLRFSTADGTNVEQSIGIVISERMRDRAEESEWKCIITTSSVPPEDKPNPVWPQSSGTSWTRGAGFVFLVFYIFFCFVL